MSDKPAPGPEPIQIKRYSSRRLYNTATSDYVTLDDVAALIREGNDVRVSDKKTGEDLTSQVLIQIIAEQESSGGGVLPINVLTDLVRSYSDQAQSMVPDFLSQSFDMLKERQQEMLDHLPTGLGDTLDPSKAMESVENWQRQQMKTLEGMMMPWFGGGAGSPAPSQEPPDKADEQVPENAPSQETGTRDAELETLKRQMAAMQQKLDEL